MMARTERFSAHQRSGNEGPKLRRDEATHSSRIKERVILKVTEYGALKF